jgi:uncharacterized peroxidase-related enzyme
MNETLLSRFPVPELDQLPDDVLSFRAFFAYHDALMEKEEGLSRAEREMIVVATSAANQCLYCVIAHGALVRVYSKNPRLADQLAVNHLGAEISERQRLMLDFALQVATASDTIEDADVEQLREAGFGDEEIWDIGAIAAFFALSNRLAAVTGLWPNHEFYLLGRVPRQKTDPQKIDQQKTE